MQKFAMHMNQWKSMGKNINRQTNNISVCVWGGYESYHCDMPNCTWINSICSSLSMRHTVVWTEEGALCCVTNDKQEEDIKST